jgi:hypothetical protein
MLPSFGGLLHLEVFQGSKTCERVTTQMASGFYHQSRKGFGKRIPGKFYGFL